MAVRRCWPRFSGQGGHFRGAVLLARGAHAVRAVRVVCMVGVSASPVKVQNLLGVQRKDFHVSNEALRKYQGNPAGSPGVEQRVELRRSVLLAFERPSFQEPSDALATLEPFRFVLCQERSPFLTPGFDDDLLGVLGPLALKRAGSRPAPLRCKCVSLMMKACFSWRGEAIGAVQESYTRIWGTVSQESGTGKSSEESMSQAMSVGRRERERERETTQQAQVSGSSGPSGEVMPLLRAGGGVFFRQRLAEQT